MTASPFDPRDSGSSVGKRLAPSLALLALAICGGWAVLASAADDDTVAKFYVAIAALDAGDNPRATQTLVDVTRAAPDEAAAWANLGLSEFRLGGCPNSGSVTWRRPQPH
jgi:hypothetical protein